MFNKILARVIDLSTIVGSIGFFVAAAFGNIFWMVFALGVAVLGFGIYLSAVTLTTRDIVGKVAGAIGALGRLAMLGDRGRSQEQEQPEKAAV